MADGARPPRWRRSRLRCARRRRRGLPAAVEVGVDCSLKVASIPTLQTADCCRRHVGADDGGERRGVEAMLRIDLVRRRRCFGRQRGGDLVVGLLHKKSPAFLGRAFLHLGPVRCPPRHTAREGGDWVGQTGVHRRVCRRARVKVDAAAAVDAG